ncbi:MAG TPA: hypothetical protein VE953_24060 [Terriglobales bacterium]|nr:hypothetical protein [Terriglobales bacterium]
MRLSPRSVLMCGVMVLASLLPASSSAFAQSLPPSAMLSSCEWQVCETVTVISDREVSISAQARPPSHACGHFEATAITPTDVVHAASGGSCADNPTWWGQIMLPRPADSVTVRVRYVSEPQTTPGEPLVSFSSLGPPAA